MTALPFTLTQMAVGIKRRSYGSYENPQRTGNRRARDVGERVSAIRYAVLTADLKTRATAARLTHQARTPAKQVKRLPWAATQLAISLADYVIVHQLATSASPTPASGAAVERTLSNYEPRRTRLASTGATLGLD